MFRVQQKMCRSCIYRPDSPLSIEELEEQIQNGEGEFVTHRVCHHSKDVCCFGFWQRHRNDFNLGRVAQRLGAVEMVEVDEVGWLDHDDAGV